MTCYIQQCGNWPTMHGCFKLYKCFICL